MIVRSRPIWLTDSKERLLERPKMTLFGAVILRVQSMGKWRVTHLKDARHAGERRAH